MELRLTKREDYEELSDWWKWFRRPMPSIELLDNLRFGLMVSKDGMNICAGFVYFTNASQFGLIEYIVSSYHVKDRGLRNDALCFLIESLKELAKSKGVKVVLSSLKDPNLIKKYKMCGFIEGDVNATNMVCSI